MSISSELTDWTSFYSAVAGVAGVLVGLLFVALALRPEIMKDTSPPGLRIWCAQTFRGLVVMLAFALIFLIPDPDGVGIGLPILLVSAHVLRLSVLDLRKLQEDPDPQWSQHHAGLRRFGFMLASHLMTLIIGFSLMLNQAELIDWMVAPIFLLLMNAAVNSWDILKAAGNLPES